MLSLYATLMAALSVPGLRAATKSPIVGTGKHGRRNFQTQHLRSFHVDDKVELSGVNDRQIGRLFTF